MPFVSETRPEYHSRRNSFCFEQNPHELDEPRSTWRTLVKLAGDPVRPEQYGRVDFVCPGPQTGPAVEPHETLAYDAVLTANKSGSGAHRDNPPRKKKLKIQ